MLCRNSYNTIIGPPIIMLYRRSYKYYIGSPICYIRNRNSYIIGSAIILGTPPNYYKNCMYNNCNYYMHASMSAN